MFVAPSHQVLNDHVESSSHAEARANKHCADGALFADHASVCLRGYGR